MDIAFLFVGVNTQGAFMRMGSDAGATAYSQAYEDEADYIGLYFLARADQPLDAALTFWRRMAAEHPEAIEERNSTHPSSPERFVRLSKTIEEIRAKQLAGEPLKPVIREREERTTAAEDFDPYDPSPAIGGRVKP